MTVTTFERVKVYASKSGPCIGCGKPTKRQRVFENTINPWNRNEDGTQRTRSEIHKKLRAEANIWQGEPVSHVRCETNHA